MRTIEEIKAEYNLIKINTPKGYTNTDLCELEFELRRALIYDIPLDRLEEICNAERDGRLKILPAKPGDIIYRPEALQFCWVITKVEIYEDEIVFIDDSDNIFRPDDIGKTVFLTKKEAEQVLSKGVKK